MWVWGIDARQDLDARLACGPTPLRFAPLSHLGTMGLPGWLVDRWSRSWRNELRSLKPLFNQLPGSRLPVGGRWVDRSIETRRQSRSVCCCCFRCPIARPCPSIRCLAPRARTKAVADGPRTATHAHPARCPGAAGKPQSKAVQGKVQGKTAHGPDDGGAASSPQARERTTPRRPSPFGTGLRRGSISLVGTRARRERRRRRLHHRKSP